MIKGGKRYEGHLSITGIVAANAFQISVFMWIDGALQADSSLTVQNAIRMFSKRFSADLDVRVLTVMYHREKTRYHKDSDIFKLNCKCKSKQ